MLSKLRQSLFRGLNARRSPIGAPPGLIDVDPTAPEPTVIVTAYGPEGFEERPLDVPQQLQGIEAAPVLWINVAGLGDEATLAAIQSHFDLHPLAMEDVVHTHQRPKVESYEKHTFIVLRAYDAGADTSEQIAIFLGDHYVITFQEGRSDPFRPVRERLRQGRGRIRQRAADYLAYALLDAVVDAYFPALEALGDELEQVEKVAFDTAAGHPDVSARINELRWKLLAARRTIWPLRDVVRSLQSDDVLMFAPDTRLYLRDCADHVVQALEHVETYQQMASTLMDGYLSVAGHRMNEVMKVLTITATIFIPLSFLAGLYGMNFDTESPFNLPELGWRYGYLAFWGLLIVVVGSMLYVFKRKGWLGR